MAQVYLTQFLIVLLTILSSALCEDDVLEFTDQDFDVRIVEYPTALVFFYAPWCGHCQGLKPEYAAAAELLSRNDPPVTLIQMDCTNAAVKTCNEHSIGSYPTLKIFHYGEYHDKYTGPRESQEIVKHMKAVAKPILKELKSISDFKNIVATTREPIVIGFFETKSELNNVFLEAVKKITIKCNFAFSRAGDILNEHKLSDGVVLFRPQYLKNKFESSSVEYSDALNVSKLNDFIISNFQGLVGVRKLDSPNNTFKLPLIVVYFPIDYDNNAKRSNYWRNRVLVVAKEFIGNVTFAISSSNEFAEELRNVEIESAETDKPVVVATNIAGKKAILKKEFSVDALKSFAVNLLSGNLEIYLKSQPIPETQEGPVLVAVAKNFEEMVLNNGKDTLIKFYAPWCGHCKNFAPIYEEVADTLKDEDIAIVKIDATANEIPSPYIVDGYPTVYWAPRDKKDSPMTYEEDGSVKMIIRFIAKRATNELKGWDRQGNPKNARIDL